MDILGKESKASYSMLRPLPVHAADLATLSPRAQTPTVSDGTRRMTKEIKQRFIFLVGEIQWHTFMASSRIANDTQSNMARRNPQCITLPAANKMFIETPLPFSHHIERQTYFNTLPP